MKMDAHGRGGLSWDQYPRQSAASLSIRYSGVVSDGDVLYTERDNSKINFEVNKDAKIIRR
jgi:hypothetical protein